MTGPEPPITGGDAVVRGLADHPRCDACGSPYLAWQIGLRCVLWRCPRCGYIRRDLNLAPARSRSTEYGGDPSSDRLRLSLTLRRLKARVGTVLEGRVVEWGCGDGSLARALAGRARRVVGVDVHPPEIDGPGVEFVRGPLEEFDEPGGFDLVIGVHVLEHVSDIGAALRHSRRLLAPGGVAYFLTPNAGAASLRVFRESWWMLEDPTHVRFLAAGSLPFLAAAAGYGSLNVRRLTLDSLAVEAASAARALGVTGPAGGGVLTSRGVQVAAALGLPVTVPLRWLRPSWSPVLEVMLRGGGR